VNDKLARALTGLAVIAVAVIAAAVSFAHIDALALSHGYTRGTARLLPFSVDGLIVASSMVLLTEARAQRNAPALARAGLVLGIAGTLAANVAYGVHFGPVGALVNAWPAGAFITATEIIVGQMRRTGTIPAPETADRTVADAVPVTVPEIVPVNAPVDTVPTVPASAPETVAARAPKRAPKSPQKVFASELAAGRVPSLRSVKQRMNVGTDKARMIRSELAVIVQEAPGAA
jgi:hypothetical protein